MPVRSCKTVLEHEDAGKQYPFLNRADKRLNTIQQAGVIREISKHIANRTVKRHNTKILTTANSGTLAANSLTVWHSTTSIRIGILP
jgi:hypothetical protein